MLIELLGLPGSGKSFLVNNLLSSHNNIEAPLNNYLYDDSRLKQNINKLCLVVSFCICKRQKTKEVILCFRNLKFSSILKKIKMFVYIISTLQIIEIIRKQHQAIYLLDEGICQVIFGISYSLINANKSDIKQMLDLFEDYISDKVILIDAEDDVILERLIMRSNSKGGSELQHDVLSNPAAINKARNILNVINDILNEKKIMILKSWPGGIINE